MKARDLNRLPVPELIDGKPWDVGEAVGHHAGTNPKQHEMLVPVEGNCDRCGLDHDRYVRCHELVHAKYSKGSIMGHATKAGVSAEAYQLAEENFIEAIVVRSYPDLDPPLCVSFDGKVHETLDRVGMAIRQGRPEVAARLAIASASGLSQLPGDRLPTGLVQTEKEIFNVLDVFAQTCRFTANTLKYREPNIVALAKRIESFLGTLDEAAEQQRTKGKTREQEGTPKETKGTPGVGAADEDKDTFRRGRQFATTITNALNTDQSGTPRWGVMELVHPPRPINLNKRFGVRKYRAAPEGARVRNISRFYTDQKVFGRKRRYKGGTLVVDTSGSMSFSQEDLEAIVEQVPATTIAVYAGAGGSGFLRVVAKGGTAAEPRWLAGPGGNEVDGPALDWLSKQREPRIWLSDGEVCTSMGSRDRGDLYADASAKCRKGNIRRVANLEQAQLAFDNPSIGVRSSYPTTGVDYPDSEEE